MAIFNRTKGAPTLLSSLTAKGAELRESQSANAESSRLFIVAAGEASALSDQNGRHAEAVEKAVAILDEAGVTL